MSKLVNIDHGTDYTPWRTVRRKTFQSPWENQYCGWSTLPSEPKVPTNSRRRFHLTQRNGYLNARHGCHFAPSLVN